MKTIKIATDYTRFPGGRLISDGKFSAQEFRQKFLEPLFSNKSDAENILIDLDDVEGFSTAFLEEVFGGLVRIVGKARVLEMLTFKCDDEPLLIEEIKRYIDMADGNESK